MNIVACIVIAGWAVSFASAVAKRQVGPLASWSVVIGSMVLAVAELA